MEKKKWSAIPSWGAAGVCAALALHSWLPDSTRGLFLRGQQLENLGQYGLALRAYRVLSQAHPESQWAAQALNRQAAILSTMGRDSGHDSQLRQAMMLYREVARRYPTFAGDALVSAGDIAFADLSDWKSARELYTELLSEFGNSTEYASQATLKLGRVALASGEREEARQKFQDVLRLYAKLPERCAEAQFHLGVLYETLWSDKEHKQWAHNAYRLTFTRYPGSIYSARAKDRLAMLFYDEAAQVPSSRVVLIDVPPIADDSIADASPTSASASALDASGGNGSMTSALRLLLASRGLDVDEVTLRGWSLRPFVAGLDPAEPARVVGLSGGDWENVLSNAGLRYLPLAGGSAREALRDLQKELDMAHPPLLFNGRWSLAVGYDSSRGRVFLQSRGAKIESVGTQELSKMWEVESPIGGRFAIIGAWVAGERPQILPDKDTVGLSARVPARRGPRSLEEAAPTPIPTPQTTATPMPRLDSATYIYTLPTLPLDRAHERALRRASSLLARVGSGRVLLGASALDALAGAFERAARPAPQVPVPSGAAPTPPPAQAEPMPDELPARASSGAAPGGESPLPAGELPEATVETPLATAPGVVPTQRAEPARTPSRAPLVGGTRPARVDNAAAARRALALRAWFGDPLNAWLEQRRDGAAFCESAGTQNRKLPWQQAAGELRASVAALENARALMPPGAALEIGAGQSELSEPTRVSLREVARLLRTAAQSERAASALMRQ